MQNPMMWLVEGLNALRSNVIATGILVGGVFLTVRGHQEGAALMAAGLAILKTSPDEKEEKKETPIELTPKP